MQPESLMRKENQDEKLAREAMDDTYEFIQKMSYQYDPMLIAAYMVIQGLGLYKTMLSPEDYEVMCEKIYEGRNRIKEISQETKLPNWCNNNLEIRSDNPNLIKKFNLALDSDGLFQALKPNPTGAWDYSWSVENWGTKWDIRGEDIQVVQSDDDRIIIVFDTAWGPPIQLYEHLEEEGYEVVGMYYEPGMAFCGIYSNGFDEHYEFGDMTSDEIREAIPDELDECFMISEYVEDLEDEEVDN